MLDNEGIVQREVKSLQGVIGVKVVNAFSNESIEYI